MKRKTLPERSLQDLFADLDAQTRMVESEQDYRKRMKAARRLAGLAILAERSEHNLTIDDLKTAHAALKLAKKSGAQVESANRASAQLSRRRLEMMGCADANIVAEKRNESAPTLPC